MSLLLPGREGVQAPKFRTGPVFARSAGREVVELAASAGLFLDGWQQADLEVFCGERDDGRWAATEVGLVVPRQNGKGAELLARQLAGLFLFGERLQTYTAHRMDTCLEHFLRVKEVIAGCPDMSRRVRKITETNGAEAITLHSGQRLLFRARSKGAGRGFTGSVVYLDEAFYLFAATVSGMLPTLNVASMSDTPPQLWYASSAPLATAESAVLRALCKRGRAGSSPSLAYAEYKGDDDAPSDGPVALADANPGLGIRLSAEFAETERAGMSDEDYSRERLGIWFDPEDDNAQWALFDEAKWQAGCAPGSKLVGPPVFGFEVAADSRWSNIAVSGVSSLGGKHVEIVANEPGSGWVVPRLRALVAKHEGAVVVCNSSGPAGVLLAECETAGVDVHGLGTAEFARACGAAYDDVTEGRWRHLGQRILDVAASAASKRAMGDTWVFDRRSGVDISPIVAAAVAAAPLGLAPKAESDFFVI